MWGLAAVWFERARREDRAAATHHVAAMSSVDLVRETHRVATHGAALRAFQRYPHLCPADASLATHTDWLAGLGASTDDPDDIADSYLTMCELAGRQAMPSVAPPLAIHAAPDPEPPSIAMAPSISREAIVAAAQIKHEPTFFAAQAFVDWARINGHCGKHKASRIGELYAEHCREEGLVPLPTKTFRPALLQVKGVRKGIDDDYPDHLGNRRHRPTIWVIDPLASVSGEIPWEELPRRVAA